ncbi:MAG: hypothetical protein DLM63_10710 [Solirubrobacterales bacterium]|nr:MAG: hypothetical protein DLM63_10710 [Solirubrobacterales bacterium]
MAPMRTGRRLLVTLSLAGALAGLAFAGLARADNFQSIFQNYIHNQGTLTPCAFSPAALKQARGQIPNDLQQYAPDFLAAIDAALAAQARGDCSRTSGHGAPASTPPAGGSSTPAAGSPSAAHSSKPAPATPAPPLGPGLRNGIDKGIPPVPAHPARSTSTPAALLLLGGLAAVLALLGLGWLLFGRLGWGSRWLTPVRHAWSEAGFRASGAFADFGDWVRLGGR